jgi:hypothetical protein
MDLILNWYVKRIDVTDDGVSVYTVEPIRRGPSVHVEGFVLHKKDDTWFCTTCTGTGCDHVLRAKLHFRDTQDRIEMLKRQVEENTRAGKRLKKEMAAERTAVPILSSKRKIKLEGQ